MSQPVPTHRTVYRRCPQPNGTFTLTTLTEALPSPLPPTSLLLRIHAIALNFRDPNTLHGRNPWPVLPNGIPCSDCAAEVLAVGSATTTANAWKPGDRVSLIFDQAALIGNEQTRTWLAADVDGVLASHVVVDEALVVRIPPHLTWAEAACLPCAGVTAWAAVVGPETRTLKAGMTVLVQGTGGVSMMAVKFVLAAGGRVVVTSSSGSKLETLLKVVGTQAVEEGRLGVVNWRECVEWELEAVKWNSGKGVDVVVDNGGAATMMRSLTAARKGGVVSQVGYLGDQATGQLEGMIPLLIDKAVALRGINVGSKADFEAMNALISATRMRFEDVISDKFDFWKEKEVNRAFESLWEGQHVGKVVIEVE